VACYKFKLESLYLNFSEKKFFINGKEVSLTGLTDFSLVADENGWSLSAKRDIIAEISEKHFLQSQLFQEEKK